MVKICNLKTDKPVVGYINIYCGRPTSFSYALSKVPGIYDYSILGNPHPMYSESQRDRSCDLFRDVTMHSLLANPDTAKILYNMKQHNKGGNNIALWCFCAPRKCHTETIKAYLDS